MSTNKLDKLFENYNHKGLSLKNRTVMAPMTRTFSPNYVPSADVADYYKRRAEGDVGLIYQTYAFNKFLRKTSII